MIRMPTLTDPRDKAIVPAQAPVLRVWQEGREP